jgi:rhodanese-related sulfurtransferase
MQLISDEVLQQFLKTPKNKVFFDIRETSEFNLKSIKGFKNIPFDQISEIYKFISKPIVLMCRSGSRAKVAALQIEGQFPKAQIFVLDENILERH